MNISKYWSNALLFILVIALFLAVAYNVYYFSDYGNWFIHPHQFEIHLPMLLSGSYEFQPSDLFKIFQQFDPAENRPRFVAYLIILVNLYTRMYTYEWGVLFPPFSWDWIITLTVGPWLIYKIVQKVSKDVAASIAAVLIYITSIGYLSAFAMPLMPSKPLTNIAILSVIFLTQKLKEETDYRLSIYAEKNNRIWIFLLSFILLVGLFLDEVPIFAFLIPFIYGFRLFIPKNILTIKGIKELLLLSIPLITPLIIFLFITIWLIPEVTSRLYGYKFDFLSSVMVNSAAKSAGRSFFSGQLYGFGLESLIGNFNSLIDLSILPFRSEELERHKSGGGVVTGVIATPIVYMATILFIGFMAIIAISKKNEVTKFLGQTLLCLILFTIFISLLSGRHVPFISGYVYGSAACIFFSLAIGVGYSLVKDGFMKSIATIYVIMIAVIQLHNFNNINQSWIELHNDGWARKSYESILPIKAGNFKTSDSELNAIWNAWQKGELNQYLDTHQISSGAVFLILELRQVEKIRAKSRVVSQG